MSGLHIPGAEGSMPPSGPGPSGLQLSEDVKAIAIALTKLARIAMRIEEAVVGLTDDREGAIQPEAGHWGMLLGQNMNLTVGGVETLGRIADALEAEVEQVVNVMSSVTDDTDKEQDVDGETESVEEAAD